MTNKLNADEIFEIAEQIERNGAKFYRRAAQNFSDSETNDLLLRLAKMEDDHEITFSRMRVRVLQYLDEFGFEYDDDVALYLHAFANDKVFDIREDPSVRVTGEENLPEIINMALDFEKQSIAFYMGVKKMLTKTKNIDKENSSLDGIIMEEMKHIGFLSSLKT